MNVSKACKKLMMSEPLYGLFLSSLNKELTLSVKTLEVSIQGINTMLKINPVYWETLSDLEQLAVLKHELMHICFFHFTMITSLSHKKLANIAMDVEVNQYIDNLPSDAITLQSIQAEINRICKEKSLIPSILESKKGSLYYYGKLRMYMDDLEDDSNHDGWSNFNNLSDAEKKLIENQIDTNLKRSAETIIKNSGKIPSELVDRIDKLFKINPPAFNWKSYFRRVIGNSIFTYTKKSKRKISKRFEDNSGIKIKHKCNILVALDTSGSINNKDLAEFFSEINHIYKTGTKITIIEADAKIQRMYEYKGKFDGEIKGRGGTDFAPVIDFYNLNKNVYTTLIYFTDGYASLTNFKLKKSAIWLISSNGKKDKYPGLTIYIPNNEN